MPIVLAFMFFFSCYLAHRDLHFSLHDALPIYHRCRGVGETPGRQQREDDDPDRDGVPRQAFGSERRVDARQPDPAGDRKSTRLNSSHTVISYAVFCLKKKKNIISDVRYHMNKL